MAQATKISLNTLLHWLNFMIQLVWGKGCSDGWGDIFSEWIPGVLLAEINL